MDVENQLFCFKVKSRGNPANVVEIDECRAAPKFGNSLLEETWKEIGWLDVSTSPKL
jgi:hypothetical protein